MSLAKRIENLENTVSNLYAQVQTMESEIFLLRTEVTELKEEREEKNDKFGSSGRG